MNNFLEKLNKTIFRKINKNQLIAIKKIHSFIHSTNIYLIQGSVPNDQDIAVNRRDWSPTQNLVEIAYFPQTKPYNFNLNLLFPQNKKIQEEKNKQ